VEPRASLEHFALSPDLKIELVASEPQIIDPVAMRFDEDGRLWVVEMRDYPLGAAGGNPATSRISLLEDHDGDGFFETATVFADGLHFATGVQPWKGGVFVTMAGQVAYMKDTDGDNKADLVETWYTGFAELNQQLRANHPRLGLDNHIYIANGLRGGMIRNKRKPDSEPVSISGMDFRFDPLTGDCEAVSGAGQFGLTFDDYGNRFVCSNRNPAIHIVLENRYLKKNPLAAIGAVTQDVARPGAESHVYPITTAWTTSNLHAGQFTAACGVAVYRGHALPKEYYGNIYTCEPTGHLVHREIMKPKGLTFESTPAEQGKEFLASRDSWFSPVNVAEGPDGALCVVDMYRAVIEHPDWMPTELQHRPDLMAGNDRGRIYRVVAKGAAYVQPPKMSSMSAAQLVQQLRNPNAWQRETASRLLLERQDKAVEKPLADMALHDKSPLARLHALRLREGLDLMQTDDAATLAALGDSDPHVVEQAIHAAESKLGKSHKLQDAISKLCHAADARVRSVAMLALAPHPTLPSHPAGPWELKVLLIAAGEHGGEYLSQLLANPESLKSAVADPKRFISDVARLAAATPDKEQHERAVVALLTYPEFCQAGLGTFLAERIRSGSSIEEIRAKLEAGTREKLDEKFAAARRDAADPKRSDEARGEAIDLLAAAGDANTIAEIARNDSSQTLRLRSIAALARMNVLDPWRGLLEQFAGDAPAVQRAVLDGVLPRGDRTSVLLDAVAAGNIKPSALDAAHVTQLLKNRDASIRERAERLFAAAIPADRQKVLAAYQIALDMRGDALRGREVFAKNCATCHRIGEVGVSVGPDISDSRERSPAQYLTDILQPNRAVDSNYFSYTALTDEGLAITGILTAETSTSITMKEASNKVTTLRRDEVEQLHSNGVSLMPEGLEKEIPPQAMADLIAFIKGWRYLPAGAPIAAP
jgi:putative membrane-bound dehydrogenase-like protein